LTLMQSNCATLCHVYAPQAHVQQGGRNFSRLT